MVSAESEDYSRFPKSILRIQARRKEKPESKASKQPDDNGIQVDTKHARASFSSGEPIGVMSSIPYHSAKRRWSMSARPVTEYPNRFRWREYNAGKVRIAVTLKRVYFVSAETDGLNDLSSFCPSRQRLRRQHIQQAPGEIEPEKKWFGGNTIFGVSSLEISRFDDGDWEKVEKSVRAYESPGGRHAVIVPGKLHGPLRYRFPKGLVNFILVANTKEERDSWVHEFRHRIAPWKYLRKRLKETTKSYSKKDLKVMMESLFLTYGGDIGSSESKSKETNELQAELLVSDGKNVIEDLAASTDGKTAVNFAGTDGSNKFLKRHQHGDMAEKFNTHVTNLVGTGATITKLADQAKHVAEVAGKVGDVAKVVGAASSLFHLVGLGATVIAKIADEKRGGDVLPKALRRIMYFLEHVLDSAVAVLMTDPEKEDDAMQYAMEDLLANHVFSGLENMLDIMSQIEDQLMRPGFVRFLNSSVLKEVDDAIKKLEKNVITIVHTRLIKKMDSLAGSSFEVGKIRTPPPLGQDFIGREKERDLLKMMLNSYGSAVIASEAGFGKTQLMIAVAEDFLRNEQNVADDVVEIASNCVGDIDHPATPMASETRESDPVEDSSGDAEKVTRIAIWVNAKGNASEVIDNLADVTESLLGKKLGDKDRGKQGPVLGKLSDILGRRKEDWLLCLDGVDNAEIDVDIDGILGRVCRMGNGQKGRVLITTRQTSVWWDGMKPEQKLTLEHYAENRSVGEAVVDESEELI